MSDDSQLQPHRLHPELYATGHPSAHVTPPPARLLFWVAAPRLKCHYEEADSGHSDRRTLGSAADVSEMRNGRKVGRIEDRQIALFEFGDRFYAVDNRCPHMGYPLSRARWSGTTLTCDWHNYKFALADGACASRDGGGGRPRLGVRVDAGRILLNLAEEPVELAIARSLRSLRFALYIQNEGRAARDAARLLALGMRPAEVMREGALHNAEREEYGWGHALAVIADCASMTEFYDGDSVAIPVVRALTSASDPVRRYKRRPTPDRSRTTSTASASSGAASKTKTSTAPRRGCAAQSMAASPTASSRAGC